MKISDLHQQLHEIWLEHGDVEVLIDDRGVEPKLEIDIVDEQTGRLAVWIG
jgi:hypothetical protein